VVAENAGLFPEAVSIWAPWCTDHMHVTITYNPWLGESFCLCGQTRVIGRTLNSSEACELIAEANAWRDGK